MLTYTIIQKDTLCVLKPNKPSTNRIVCFDLDWTLVYGAKKLFPSDPDDIHLLPRRKKLLKSLYSQGYSIVIFTNQYASSKKEREKRYNRILTFLKELNVPCWVSIAFGKDKENKKTGEITLDNYRKPAIGMWYEMMDMFGECEVDYYCGDAAGRPQDFSDSDKKFAENINVPFKTPQEIFPPCTCKPRQGLELVVFVGMPGCGKTTTYKEIYQPMSYVHVNQDLLKSKVNVLKMIKNSVNERKSMVIDATNPEQTKRKEYYSLVDNDYKITIVYFTRDGRGWNDLRRPNHVPTIVYHKYFKNLVEPTVDEIPSLGKVYKVW